MYRAMATVKAKGKEWNMTVCDLYETEAQAAEGIKRFRQYGRGKAKVIKTWIEEV